MLPFVNASADPENEYFSDGMTDELITALAKVEGLRVASRTSVFALKGGRRTCARSVRGSASPPCSRARCGSRATGCGSPRSSPTSPTGGTLWSERYDRELEDVFAIQDEIAQHDRRDAAVDAARATSATRCRCGTPRTSRRTTCTSRDASGGTGVPQAGDREGIRYFEQAIDEDAGYALAYTGLADSYALQVDYRSAPVREGMERAKAEARRALELDETLAEAHTSLGWVTVHLRLGLGARRGASSTARSSSIPATRWRGSGTRGF